MKKRKSLILIGKLVYVLAKLLLFLWLCLDVLKGTFIALEIFLSSLSFPDPIYSQFVEY